MEKEVRSFCRICIANCGIIATVDDSTPEPTVVKVRGDKDHPQSKGYTCSKGRALPHLHHHPNRLDFPAMRQTAGGELLRSEWGTVLDDLGSRLSEVVETYGPSAVAAYYASGVSFDAPGRPVAEKFFRRLGSVQKYTALTIDCPNKKLVAELMGGWPWLQPTWHEEESPLLLLMGMNPAVSHGHTTPMTNPRARLRAQSERGELWVVDPRRTETARMADGYIQTRAGTDHLILGYLVRELLAQGADEEFIKGTTVGVEVLRRAVAPMTLDMVSGQCAIAPSELEELLAAVRRAGRLTAILGTGVSMSPSANVAEWLMWCLLAVTGSLDRPGGVWFNPGYLARNDTRSYEPAPICGNASPGTASRPDIAGRFGELPCSSLLPEIEAGNVKALFVLGGNVLTAFPDAPRMQRALRRLDVVAVSHVVATQTTRLATHMLPSAGQLERAEVPVFLDTVQDAVMCQRTPAVVPPAAERRPSWWMFAQLAERMGMEVLPRGFNISTTTDEALLEPFVARSLDPVALAEPYAVSVAGGATFGWVTDRVLPDGRWRLAPPLLVDQLASQLSVPAARTVLLPRRQLRTFNSALTEFASEASEFPSILVNRYDADVVGIVDGDPIIMTSAQGRTEGRAVIIEDIMKGAVSFPHGWSIPDPCGLTSTDNVEAVGTGECDVIGLGRPTVTTTDAADQILTGRADALEVHQVRAGMRGVLGRFVNLKSLDGILELSWHTDQLHRVGAGLTPDLNRGRIATTLALVRRNGTTSFGRKRGL